MNPTIRLLRTFILAMLLMVVDFSIARGLSLPDSAYVAGVNGHAQSYSLSCEARSAVDLAAYWGFDIDENEFLQALPRSDNPDQGFVGNINEVWGRLPPHSYGVHAGPVAQALRDYGLRAEARYNLKWDDLRGEISAGQPVIVWVIGQMWSGTAVDYKAQDGRTVRVAAFEHTMLLTGYSTEGVQVIDAYSGQYQYYPLNTFLKSWAVLGNMAVVSSGEDLGQDEHVAENLGDTYIVQEGDFLVALADEFNTTWQELAELNGIDYPYTIYSGQVLQLPKATTLEAEVNLEPTPVADAPAEKGAVIKSTVRLPMVLQNSTAVDKPANVTSNTSQEHIKVVTVQHTESLVDFGRRIGIAWHILARLNNLPADYTVQPGEVLWIK